MTCKFLFCFWSDTESQLQAVCSFFLNWACYMFLCCRQRCVNTLFLFKRKAKRLIALNVIDKLCCFFY